jgi:hypothetical protein
MSSAVDLLSLFQAVSGTLQENRTDLNKADTHNNDHGDNMVEIFELITQAMGEMQSAEPAEQLAHASKLLQEKQSGSAQMYSKGLSQAAQQFQGQQITSENAALLLQILLGGGEAPMESSAPGDMLGSLLSGLTGGSQGDDEALDAGDLLNAGLAFMQSKQRGESNLDALMDAIVSASSMAEVPHRAQSSKLVADTLFSLLGGS